MITPFFNFSKFKGQLDHFSPVSPLVEFPPHLGKIICRVFFADTVFKTHVCLGGSMARRVTTWVQTGISSKVQAQKNWARVCGSQSASSFPLVVYYWLILEWRQWYPTPVLLPGKSRGRRSLVGCSPWGRWESGTTERLDFHVTLSCIGEGKGNPLQCPCLENPRDGEPGGLPSTGSHRVRHDWSDLAASAAASEWSDLVR